MQDDFKGQTSFNAAARLDFTELNSLGAESVWDLQVGTAPLLATELYLPLSNVTRYFIAPHAQVEAHEVAQVEDGRQVGQYRVRSVDYGLDFGRELGNWGEVRIGAQNSSGSRTRDPRRLQPAWIELQCRSSTSLRFGYDQLNSPAFPHTGQALTAQVSFEDNGGGERGTDLFTLDWRGAHSWARNTLVAWVSAGSTIGGSQTNVRTFFPLGGFLNLSGVRAETLAGPQYAIGAVDLSAARSATAARAFWRCRPTSAPRSRPATSGPMRSEISLDTTRKDFSLFFGADTYIGPAYLAAGYDDSGSYAFYLFLGRSF